MPIVGGSASEPKARSGLILAGVLTCRLAAPEPGDDILASGTRGFLVWGAPAMPIVAGAGLEPLTLGWLYACAILGVATLLALVVLLAFERPVAVFLKGRHPFGAKRPHAA